MPGEVITLLLALIGVGVLVLAAKSTNGSAPPELRSITQLDHLLTLLPQGFIPLRAAIDPQSRCAIMADAAGRLAVASPVGAHFVVRLCDSSFTSRRAGETLEVRGPDVTAFIALPLDDDFWPLALKQSGLGE